MLTRKGKRYLKHAVVGCATLWIISLLIHYETQVKSGKESVKDLDSATESIYDSNSADRELKGILEVAPSTVSTTSNRAKLDKLREAVYRVPRPTDEKYAINETKSEEISLTRNIPDTRPPECKERVYAVDTLPTVSVIIPMYNEAPSMLLRTVHSILSKTPPSLLADIIIVDDMSTNENMKQPLTDYINELSPVVRILRLKKKAHLIRARMAGASIAKGDVLLFQDGHTELNEGWAEPVLDYIKRHRESIVQPAVDEIGQWDIEYEHPSSENHNSRWRGVFLWDMRYAWQKTPSYYKSWLASNADPYPCPILVGCSIAVDKNYFNKIGGFDTGLDIWGGEQIELSFRAWMCGGRVIIHPCSRTGHVFKPWMKSDVNWKKREEAIAKNNIRVGETWMGRYSSYYYASNRIYDFKRVNLTAQEIDGIRQRRQLSKDLKCKDFDWYLENILPELKEPHRDATFFGEISNQRSSKCLYTTEDGYIGLTSDCYVYSRFQQDGEFSFRANGILMHGVDCILVNVVGLLKLASCDSLPSFQEKIFFRLIGQGQTLGKIIYTQKGYEEKCLEQVTNVLPEHNREQMPQFRPCQDENEFQIWASNYHFEYDLVPPPLFEGDLRLSKDLT